MTGKTKVILTLSLIIVLLLSAAYLGWSYYNAEIKAAEAKIEAERQLQNAQAYKDSLEMKERELQDNAAFVYDLQNENTQLKKEVAYVKSKFVLLLDSIEVLNQGAVSYNYGDSIIVKFEGKKGRVTYKGQTTYFTLKDTGTYSIKINQDPIKIESYVYLNETDNLIYNRIYADSVLIDDAYTVVDSALYNKLKMPTTINIETPQLGFFDNLEFYGEYIQPFALTPETEVKSELNVGVTYHFDIGIGLTGGRKFVQNEWFAGVRYSLTPKSLWGLIF